ncbi:S1 family peptidase [Planomonospora venezuelensis]|uniref:Streptogrisin C n=1 Tax=Planomonospora venezuelensis TaxID=1999 RepID=A0A841D972_PLAVE|nr:S1 family peptidase [Planomonospora venezuelensis]MBB5966039.1 streptogrisin C [Planomonospora venezuelensis]GIN03649.1 hypothetical protein Pve01_53070 [Planomonospora venezuelensis]
MTRTHSFLAGAAAAVLFLTASPAASASPAPPSPPSPPSPMADALQRDLGLTPEQAAVRLAREERAVAVESSLRRELGETYGGAWLTGDDAQLVVATTDPALFGAIGARGARPVLATRTLAQLDAVKNRLDRAPAPARAAASLWYVDVPTGTVVVQATGQAGAEALLAAAGVDPSSVRVVISAERPRPLVDVAGGDPFSVGSSRCTVGFTVTRGTTQGFVTAGHCGRAGATTRPPGTVRGSSFPGNDYAWVALGPGYTAQPWVRGPGGSIVLVRGSAQAVVGSSICRSGTTTGWRCGTVQQHNASVTYPQGTVTGLTRTSVCAEPGDSGGPFISGSQAQGVTSGGSGTCSSGGTTFHQPVNEILRAYGLTLRVA